MKKFLILPVLTLLTIVGVFAFGQQSKAAHAQAPTTVVQKTIQTPEKQDATVSGEKTDTKEVTSETKGIEVAGTSETKGAETDAPGRHQDPQGSNVNHDFQGTE